MTWQNDDSVADLVARYLANVVSVGELEHSLPDGWEIDHLDERHRVATLKVIGLVAEHSAGEIQEHELRDRLRPFAGWTLTTELGTRPVKTVISAALVEWDGDAA